MSKLLLSLSIIGLKGTIVTFLILLLVNVVSKIEDPSTSSKDKKSNSASHKRTPGSFQSEGAKINVSPHLETPVPDLDC